MKRLFVLAAAVGLLAVGSLRAADTDKSAHVAVVFDHPEKFTDIRDNFAPTEKGQKWILEQIRSYIVGEAGQHFVPVGDKLTVTFTDIHLAGDYEPWLGMEYDHIRVMKPIYPPSFKFNYTETDASGKVLKEGQEKILDTGYELRHIIHREDPLAYEKDILHDWMNQALGTPK